MCTSCNTLTKGLTAATTGSPELNANMLDIAGYYPLLCAVGKVEHLTGKSLCLVVLVAKRRLATETVWR